MATFRNARAVLGDTPDTVYETPPDTTAIVLHCQVSNRDGLPRAVSLFWTDVSDGDVETYLLDTVTVPNDASLEGIVGKLVLEAGDRLRALQDENDDEIEVSVSVLELGV